MPMLMQQYHPTFMMFSRPHGIRPTHIHFLPPLEPRDVQFHHRDLDNVR